MSVNLAIKKYFLNLASYQSEKCCIAAEAKSHLRNRSLFGSRNKITINIHSPKKYRLYVQNSKHLNSISFTAELSRFFWM